MLYFSWIVDPAVRWVTGQSLLAALYAAYFVVPAPQICPSGTKPTVRPAIRPIRPRDRLVASGPPFAGVEAPATRRAAN